jgi:hypothetical protein
VETRRKAYAFAKPMFWPHVGRQYLELFGRVVLASEKRQGVRSHRILGAPNGPGPAQHSDTWSPVQDIRRRSSDGMADEVSDVRQYG